MDRDRPAGRGHRPRAGHGRGREGRQRAPGHRDEPRARGVPAVPEGHAPQPGRPRLDRSRPVRPLGRATARSRSTPSSSWAAGASRSRTSRRCASGAPRPPATPSVGHTAGVETTTGPLGQGVANAVGMAMAARRERGLLDPQAGDGASLFDHRVFAICSDGDIEEGVSAEASALAGGPGPRQPDRDLRRQPDLDRGRHRHRAGRGRRARATRPTAGTCRPSTGPTAATSTSRTSRSCTTRSWRPTPSPTGPASSCSGRSSPGPPRTRRTPAPRTARALGAEEVAATKEVLGLRPGADLRDPGRACSSTPAPPSSAARPPRPRGTRSSSAGPPPTRPSAADLRADAHPHPARGLGRRPAVLPRRQGRRHPQGLGRGHQRASPAEGARAVGRLGRPRRLQQHHDRGRPVVPARPSAPPTRGRATRTPVACCTSASASTRWARS